MAKFLCLTLNPAIDFTLTLNELHIGEVNRQQAAHRHPAGKGLNVAQVLCDLGHEVWVSGFLGNDNADIFKNHFEKQGFHDDFVYVNGETRTNIKIAEAHGRMTDVNGLGFSVSPSDKEKLFSKINHLAEKVDYIAVSGSLPRDFSQDDFRQLLNILMAHNPRVAVDTSGAALTTALACRPYLVKPNTDELAESLGMQANTPAEQAALFQQSILNAEHAVISMGDKGVNWLQGHQILHASAAPVAVKSTVGAGDTLLAGVLHGMANHYSDKEILQTAAALAAHAVSQIGFGVPDAARLDELKQAISVNYVSAFQAA